MMNVKKTIRNTVLCLLGAVGLCAGGFIQMAAAEPAPIAPDAAVDAAAVKPLTVQYYNFGRIRPPGNSGIDSMAIAADWVNTHSADATVMLTAGVIDLPGDGANTMSPSGQTLGAFLFGALNMEQMELDGQATADMKVGMSSRNIFVFKGYVKVDEAGVYDFRIPCDDAAQLKIGGVVVLTTPEGGKGPGFWDTYHGQAEFFEPGIYPVGVLYYDKAGVAGVDVLSTVNSIAAEIDLGNGQKMNLLKFLP